MLFSLAPLLISALPLPQGPPPPEPPLLLPSASLFVRSAQGWVLPGHTGLGPQPLVVPTQASSKRVTCFSVTDDRVSFRIHSGAREDGSPHSIDAILVEALQHSVDHELFVVEGVPWLMGPAVPPARIERPSEETAGDGEPEDLSALLLRQDTVCVQGGLIDVYPPEKGSARVDSMILIGGEEPFEQQGWPLGYSYRRPAGGWFMGFETHLPSTPRQALSLPVPTELLRIQLVDEARIDRLFFASITLPQAHHFRRLDLAHARLGSGVRGKSYRRDGQGPPLFALEFSADARQRIDERTLMSRVADGDSLMLELEENAVLEVSFDAPPEAEQGKTWTLLVRVIYPDPQSG